MKPFLLTLLLLFAAGTSHAWAQETGAAGADTAEDRFRNAYRLLSEADQARDEQRFSLALDLYRQALDHYIDLADTYPDWQPTVIRFRLSYCDNQLKALLKNIEDGNIRLTADAAEPAPTDPRPASDLSEPGEIDALIRQGKVLLAEQNPAEAKRLLLRALKMNPDNVAVRLLIGIAQCQARRFGDAVFLLENLVKEDPDLADAHVILGTAYFGLNQTDKAVAQITRALELNPSHKEAHFNLAQIALATRPPDLDTAAEHYRKALSLGVARDRELDAMLME